VISRAMMIHSKALVMCGSVSERSIRFSYAGNQRAVLAGA
jgi:hypothetical protein